MMAQIDDNILAQSLVEFLAQLDADEREDLDYVLAQAADRLSS